MSVVLDSLTATDRVNLLELYARSVMLLELNRASDWADLFEPPAVLICSGAQHFAGHKQLLEVGRRMVAGEFDLAAGILTPPVRCRRVLTDISLYAGKPGHAKGYAHLTVTASGAARGPRWLASGTWADELTKCAANCWRFASRTFMSDEVNGHDASRDPPRGSMRA